MKLCANNHGYDGNLCPECFTVGNNTICFYCNSIHKSHIDVVRCGITTSSKIPIYSFYRSYEFECRDIGILFSSMMRLNQAYLTRLSDGTDVSENIWYIYRYINDIIHIKCANFVNTHIMEVRYYDYNLLHINLIDVEHISDINLYYCEKYYSYGGNGLYKLLEKTGYPEWYNLLNSHNIRSPIELLLMNSEMLDTLHIPENLLYACMANTDIKFENILPMRQSWIDLLCCV